MEEKIKIDHEKQLFRITNDSGEQEITFNCVRDLFKIIKNRGLLVPEVESYRMGCKYDCQICGEIHDIKGIWEIGKQNPEEYLQQGSCLAEVLVIELIEVGRRWMKHKHPGESFLPWRMIVDDGRFVEQEIML